MTTPDQPGSNVTITDSDDTQVARGNNIVQIMIDKLTLTVEREEATVAMKDYLASVFDRVSELPLRASASDTNKRVELAAVYVGLDVTASAICPRRPRITEREASSLYSESSGADAAWSIVGGGPHVDEGWLVRRAPYGVSAQLQANAPLDRMWRSGRSTDRVPGKTSPSSDELHHSDGWDGRRLSALEYLSACRRLVLVGPPGSGKSVFAKFVTMCLAGEWLGRPDANLDTLAQDVRGAIRALRGPKTALPVPVWPHGPLLPLFADLRAFVASESFMDKSQPADADRLLSYLMHALSGAYSAVIKSCLVHGNALLVLDGLDEIRDPSGARDRLLSVIRSFVRRYDGCRILITSRPYAYQESVWRLDDDGFANATLAPLDGPLVRAFLRRWFAVLPEAPKDGTAAARADALAEEVLRDAHLAPLAERPLMLTMLADLNASRGGHLPANRAALYDGSVGLLLDRWNQRNERQATGADELGMSVAAIKRALKLLAYTVHREQGGGDDVAGASITSSDILRSMQTVEPGNKELKPLRVAAFLHERSGILLSDGEPSDTFHFPHRSYQEYLAACHLVELEDDEDVGETLRDRAMEDRLLWREVVRFAVGTVAGPDGKGARQVWPLITTNLPAAPLDSEDRSDLRFGLALDLARGLMASSLAPRFVERYVTGIQAAKAIEHLRLWLARAVETGAFGLNERLESADLLGAGDPRPGVSVRHDGVPDIAWVDVPDGRFIMGSRRGDEDALNTEYRYAPVHVPAFRISRFPITVAQFRPFVDGDGYTNDAYWPTEAGLQWRQREHRDRPRFWGELQYSRPSQPVVGVTWYEALAYCRWLSERGQERVRLPREEEWEKAARGARDARAFPWGHEFDTNRANTSEGQLGRPTPVGLYAAGVTPWPGGPLDMSGNVWEWCVTKWRASYTDGDEDNREEGPAARVVRGGSFYDESHRARCAYRNLVAPDYSWLDRGFRVATAL